VRNLCYVIEHVCESLGLKPVIVEVASGEISGAVAALMQERAQALWAPDDLWDYRVEIVESATKYSLPIMTDESSWVREAGALIAYSTTFVEQCRKRAEYIDRILRGAKPAELPVQQPTKFELVINLKTAKALALTIPPSLLLRADEVIQ
jgi:putative ABC transport system substrate-binding protein